MANDERPSRKLVKKSESPFAGTKERLRNALITGTAGGYLGGMLIEGKTRVKVPDFTRRLLRMKRKTIGVHGARTGAAIGAAVGASNRGKRSETADSVATGGDWKFATVGKLMAAQQKWNATRTVSDPWGEPTVSADFVQVREQVKKGKTRQQWEKILKKMQRPTAKIVQASLIKKMRPSNVKPWNFSAYIEDMTFGGLPKEVQKDVQRFVTAEKGTPVVHYGMTVKELLGKADPENLKAARKALGTLRASKAADEVISRTKDGSKYVLLMNDRIVDGHHFLAKAERGGVTSSLNVLDLTPARLGTKAGGCGCQMADGAAVTQFEEEKKKSGWKRKAAIAAGATAGAVLGARTLPRLIRRGRPLKEGEELAGKVLYTHEGLTTPASVVNIGGKTLRRRLEKKALKGSKLAGAALKVDDFLGIPQRHYGIGAGGGRVIEKTKAHGPRMVSKEGFARGNRVQVDSDTLPKDSSKWGEWAKGMEKRNEAAQGKAKRGDLCLIGNNCEHHARDIAGQGRKSYQSRAIVGGAVGGAAAGGAAVGAMTKRKREEKQMGVNVNAMLLHLFEEARERRNRVRDLRDKIGLVKDTAGLAGVTAAGVGGVKLYRAAKGAIQRVEPQMRDAATGVKEAVDGWKKTAATTNENVERVGRLAGNLERRLDAPKRKAMIESRMKLRNEKRKAAGKSSSNLSKAMQGKGVKAPKMAVGLIQRLMLNDPRLVRTFARKQPAVVVQPPQRDGWQKARDGALIAGGAAAVGAAGYTAHKAGKAIKGLAKRGRVALRQVPQVTDNLQNATSISADMGRLYRKARKVITDSVAAYKEGQAAAEAAPTPKWAKRAVRIGKKLRLLEAGAVNRAAMNEFILGALGTIAGTLGGAYAGSQMRSKVYRAIRQKYGPGKWAKRAARVGALATENAGGIVGGAAGSFLTGGMRKKPEEEEQFNALLVQALHEFGGRALPGQVVSPKVAGTSSYVRQGSKGGLEKNGSVLRKQSRSALAKSIRESRRERADDAWRIQQLKKQPKAGGLRAALAAGLITGGVGAAALYGTKKVIDHRLRKREERMKNSNQFNALLVQALREFGGNEQLADLDNSRFVDPFSKWLKGEKGYRRADVGDYHKLRRRLLGRDLKPEQIAKIQGAMADIKANKAVHVAGGQVLHSALRKADTVRKVSERGSGLVRDAVKAAKGEAREKDRWGREKKREWEKPWFQRRRNQLIATGGLLAAGYLGRHTKVGARAVRKGEEMINKGRTWANKKLANVFPDEGTEAARAAHNAKVTGKPQSTPADILKETEEMAKATRKEASQLNKAKKKVEEQGPELKLVPESKPAPKPAAAAPKPAPKPADSKPADKSVRAPVSKPEASSPAPAPKPADSKPADKSVRAPVSKSPAPPVSQASGGSPWAKSKIPTVSTNEKRHEAAAVKAAAKPAAPKKKEAPVFESMWGGADKPKKPKKFAALLRQALTQFEKPFAGYNPKRHARTGGLNDSFRTSYNREHGSNLKRPVTTPPSKLKPGSEAAGRRKSFCARMSGMQGPTSKGGKLTPKGAALRRWNCMAIQALTQFADPLDVGWDIRDARGNSARVFAPQAGQRDRRPKRWHERVENERKLWAGAALTSTLAGGAAMRKLLGKQTKQTVDREVKRRVAQIGAAVKKRYVKKPSKVTAFPGLREVPKPRASAAA